MALSRMRLRLARGRRRAVRGRGLFREEIMLSGFIVLTSECQWVRIRAWLQPCRILFPRLVYAPMGRNCQEGVRLLCSCAVPARDLTFRYLAARLKPCPDTNLSM